MEYYIFKDEIWPHFILEEKPTDARPGVEISDELVKEYHEACASYFNVRSKILDFVKEDWVICE